MIIHEHLNNKPANCLPPDEPIGMWHCWGSPPSCLKRSRLVQSAVQLPRLPEEDSWGRIEELKKGRTREGKILSRVSPDGDNIKYYIKHKLTSFLRDSRM